MGVAGVMLLVSMQTNAPLASVLAIGMAALCNDLAMPGAWGACMDVGGRHAGALSGSMNMMGNAGGAIAPPSPRPFWPKQVCGEGVSV